MAGVAAALLVVGAFQYHWMVQSAQAERERQTRVLVVGGGAAGGAAAAGRASARSAATKRRMKPPDRAGLTRPGPHDRRS